MLLLTFSCLPQACLSLTLSISLRKEYTCAQAPPDPSVLVHGPFALPRVLLDCQARRSLADLETFVERPGGGEGVRKLLRARDLTEISFGYDWIHTILVRAIPPPRLDCSTCCYKDRGEASTALTHGLAYLCVCKL